jgi:hypothetical protein
MCCREQRRCRERTGGREEDRFAAPEVVEHRGDVRPRHLVYWGGEQRSGTLRGVDRQTAEHWQRDGFVDIGD